METQLLRLDKPYNVICGNNGNFALHIATLMVITEVERKDETGKVVEMVPWTRCYPVVGNTYKMDGEVWMNEEQKDCLVICRENETVSLYTLKRIMEFCAKKRVSFYTEKMPHFFSTSMLQYECRIELPKNDKGRLSPITRYASSLKKATMARLAWFMQTKTVTFILMNISLMNQRLSVFCLQI